MASSWSRGRLPSPSSGSRVEALSWSRRRALSPTADDDPSTLGMRGLGIRWQDLVRPASVHAPEPRAARGPRAIPSGDWLEQTLPWEPVNRVRWSGALPQTALSSSRLAGARAPWPI